MSEKTLKVGGKPKQKGGTLRRLLGYLGRNKFLLFTVFILSAISTLGAVYGSYAISPLITIIENGLNGTISRVDVTTQLIRQLSILFIIYAFEIVASYLSSRFMVKISQQAVKDIRKDMFSRILRIDIRYHDINTHGELMSRFINDIDLVTEGLNSAAASLVSNALSLVGTLIAMFILSPILTIATVIILPLLSLMSRTVVKFSRKYAKLQQQSLGKLNGFVEEAMEGQIVTQLFNHQEQSNQEMRRLSEIYRKNNKYAQITSLMMIPLMQNLNTINYAIIGVLGGYLTINHGLSVGNLGAYVNMTRRLGFPINEIANQYTILQSSVAAAERIFELIDWPLEPVDSKDIMLDQVEGDVVFSDVRFGYKKGVDVLKGVSFWAKKGQKIAFVGSTGSGKTTMINLITRFYDIDSGSATLDGIELKDINRYSLRNQIAMVLQDTHLFTGTIMDNIRYGNLDASDEACIEAAKLANAHHFIKRLEYGYQTVISGSGDELSQGQRQLLNIARAAVANPKILILDEATSSIDTRTERLIEKGMDRLMAGRTTFIIAHRLSTVRNSDAILVLEQGEILERGDHDSLLKLGGRYASLYTGQSELE
ncbi:multidrug ABC transporter ATP-binding protein [Erysipelothrix larvae]|uniref:Multidrug ABC transporter ATP-binding protein n=1 Tax=Erysipelothrix larvae TaxID=1514105 RepID=A0A0X8GZB7_9FIRM|nr:ABC transporter ATP-binding protein [Erysipelothrix larvae]AMC93155.1 multidrug ABC transporter ATP-binding protein [Erysipelothrix larvae]